MTTYQLACKCGHSQESECLEDICDACGREIENYQASKSFTGSDALLLRLVDAPYFEVVGED